MRRILLALFALPLIVLAFAAEKRPLSTWSFDQDQGPDEVRGFHKFVPGVSEKSER